MFYKFCCVRISLILFSVHISFAYLFTQGPREVSRLNLSIVPHACYVRVLGEVKKYDFLHYFTIVYKKKNQIEKSPSELAAVEKSKSSP